MFSIDFNKIKLVVWDLDDCFWQGILSEGPVKISAENAKLIPELSKAGIINSICSKNDRARALEELSKANLASYFVFASIDWTPKGERIKALISEMALRPQNVLFIDDNPSNLEEAKYYVPEIMTLLPNGIEPLRQYAHDSQNKDPEMKRLAEYRVLETKVQDKTHYSSNEAFLRDSQIEAAVSENCLPEEKRLYELVNRTNQLNYTKKRESEEDFINELSNPKNRNVYVQVRDRYGDYGIVGFASLTGTQVNHFLFSCRTMGMGIERFLYDYIGRPDFVTVEPVTNPLEKDGASPDWIHLVDSTRFAPSDQKIQRSQRRFLFKGPCDMLMVFNYLKANGEIVTEFTHTKEDGTSIESSNHTCQIAEAPRVSKERASDFENLPFGDSTFFSKAIDSDFDIVFLSTFTDSNLGVYQDKKNQLKIAFGEFTNDLTNPKNEEDYRKGSLYNAGANFPTGFFEEFRQRFTFLGRSTPEETFQNILAIRAQMKPSTLLVLFLGSEIAFEGNKTPADEKREEWFRRLNALVKDYAKTHNDIRYINFTDAIESQADFNGSINHFQPRVYYKVAQACSDIINETVGEKTSQRKGGLFFAFTKFKRFVKKILKKE